MLDNNTPSNDPHQSNPLLQLPNYKAIPTPTLIKRIEMTENLLLRLPHMKSLEKVVQRQQDPTASHLWATATPDKKIMVLAESLLDWPEVDKDVLAVLTLQLTRVYLYALNEYQQRLGHEWNVRPEVSVKPKEVQPSPFKPSDIAQVNNAWRN